MIEDEIVSIEIDDDGKLCVSPASQQFPYIHRAGMEVSWNAAKRCLFGPKPREWTYSKWFRQITAATNDEYGVLLRLTDRTTWINIPDDVRADIDRQP